MIPDWGNDARVGTGASFPYRAPPPLGDAHLYVPMQIQGLLEYRATGDPCLVLKAHDDSYGLLLRLATPAGALIQTLWAEDPSAALERAIPQLAAYPRTWRWRFQTFFRLPIDAMHITLVDAQGRLTAGVTIRGRQEALEPELALLLAMRDYVPIDVSEYVLAEGGERWPPAWVHPLLQAYPGWSRRAPAIDPEEILAAEEDP